MQSYVLTLLILVNVRIYIEVNLLRAYKHIGKTARYTVFVLVHSGEHYALFSVLFDDDDFAHYHIVENNPVNHIAVFFFVHFKKSADLADHFSSLKIRMSVFARALLKHVPYTRRNSKTAVLVKAHFKRDFIRRNKTYAVNVLYHLIGIFLYYTLGAVPVSLIYFKCEIEADIEILEI